ncbi:MAG TPA: tetratricopeptide repeat protein [Spirochaetota bacterium]|nr:tetratricopeptide repeat protein [Spirochaetota bacterium]HPI89449.1 tetratricopeptide repeat protein [Spirochaetota bacterium]HPR46883.1 tetratricopeptide repeat protein [Spirochaetota bacterium]
MNTAITTIQRLACSLALTLGLASVSAADHALERAFIESFKLKNITTRLEYHDRIIALEPGSPYAQCCRGYRAYVNRDYRAAESHFTGAIEMKGDCAIAYKLRAACRARLNDYRGQINDFTRIISLEPDDWRPYYYRAHIETLQGSCGAAIKDYSAAIRLAPGKTDAYYYRSLCNRLTGNYYDALRDLDSLLSIDPENLRALVAKGEIWSVIGDNEAALDFYNRALDLNQSDVSALYKRGGIRADRGDAVESVQDLDRALKLDPGNPQILFRKGKVLYGQANFREAIKNFSRSLDRDPGFTEARRYHALCLIKLNRPADAEEELSGIIRLKRHDRDAYFQRGHARVIRKKYEEAIHDFTAAINIDPGFGRAYVQRALTYLLMGDKSRAETDLKKAFTLGEKQAVTIFEELF